MGEKLTLASRMLRTEGITKEDKRREAEYYIKGKILYLVLTWECNRDIKKSPCDICFATDVMHHARDNGYQKAKGDFLQKTKALSKLPWKEIVINGGEPTMDTQLLEDALYSISSERKVRIITNGDWILKEASRERILSVIGFHPNVRVEISAHDPFEVFKRKINAVRGRVKLGVQIRDGEGLDGAEAVDVRKKKEFLGTMPDVFVEEHKVLRLGQAAANKEQAKRSVSLNLRQLMTYSRREKNAGTYVVPGPNGVRVIGDHESPYLVFPTPSEIADANDTPGRVVEKVIDFYATPTYLRNNLDEIVGYAEAAFKTGIGIDISDYFLIRDDEERLPILRKLMSMYYKVLSEKEGISIEEVRRQTMYAVAEALAGATSARQQFRIEGYPLACEISWLAPKDIGSFLNIIKEKLIVLLEPPYVSFNYDNGDPLERMRGSYYNIHWLNLVSQLTALGVRPEEVYDEVAKIKASNGKKY